MNTPKPPSPSPLALWTSLLQANVVEGEMPAPDPVHSINQPWYIRVMLGFSGWLGALFLMGFVGILFSLAKDHGIVTVCIGAGLCTLAYMLFRLPGNNDFLLQFALAVSLAGQGFFVFGLFQELRSDGAEVYLVIFVFEVLLTVYVSNWIHRFLTTLAAVFSAYFFFQQSAIFGVIHGLVALAVCGLWWSPILLRKPELLRPVAYALGFALLCTEGGRFVSRLVFDPNHGWWLLHGWRVGTSLVNLALLASTVIVIQRQHFALNSLPAIVGLLAAIILCGFSYVAPGLSSALLLILIAYSFSDRVLLGVGLFALLSFVSHYYYQLQVSLLYKSIVLMSLGLLLLATRVLLGRLFPETRSTASNVEKESSHG
jgi:uncharacterized membrane protein